VPQGARGSLFGDESGDSRTVEEKLSREGSQNEIPDRDRSPTPDSRDTDQEGLDNLKKKIETQILTLDVEIIDRLAESLSTRIKEYKSQSRGDKDGPSINRQEKKIRLPKGFLDTDYIIGNYVIVLAHSLGYDIELYVYSGQTKELTGDEEKLATGISFSISDTDIVLNLSNSAVNPYEEGRKYARSQYILGLANQYKFTGALKKKKQMVR
jgi:hypothetical protein